MFTLGIPKTQYRRATQVLGHERSEPIEYNAERQDDGFYIFKFPFADEYDFRDIVKLLKQNGITTIGADDQLTERQIMKLVNLVPLEEMDMNDPILIKMRAAKMKADKSDQPKKSINPDYAAVKNAKKIAFLKKEREQLMRDMEQEAEPEGGPIADRYGAQLNRIDKAIAKLTGSETMTYDQAIAEIKVGDKVTFKSGGGDMEVIGVRDMFSSDLKAYRVKNADGETFEYSEDQLQLAEDENTDLIRKAIRQEIKTLHEGGDKGLQAARNLIAKLREKTYRSFSDEDLDAFSKEMALHFIDNRAAEAALMMRNAKMKGDDYKPGTTDELPFE